MGPIPSTCAEGFASARLGASEVCGEGTPEHAGQGSTPRKIPWGRLREEKRCSPSPTG
jgi:hypothetical protein